MSMITLTLPPVPSVNHIYIRTGKRVVKTQEARDYLDQVWLAAKKQHGWNTTVDLEPPFIVELTFIHTDARKHDIDNGMKILLDSLAKVFKFDDNDIIELHCYKRYESRLAGQARIEVTLKGV